MSLGWFGRRREKEKRSVLCVNFLGGVSEKVVDGGSIVGFDS
jgi:hypothetical protein